MDRSGLRRTATWRTPSPPPFTVGSESPSDLSECPLTTQCGHSIDQFFDIEMSKQTDQIPRGARTVREKEQLMRRIDINRRCRSWKAGRRLSPALYSSSSPRLPAYTASVVVALVAIRPGVTTPVEFIVTTAVKRSGGISAAIGRSARQSAFGTIAFGK